MKRRQSNYRPWGAMPRVLGVSGAVIVAAVIGCSAYAHHREGGLGGMMTAWFGPPVPPAAALGEAYEQKADSPRFDHSLMDQLLSQYVDEHGWVDYAGLADDPQLLDQYLGLLAVADFEALGRDEKLALLINAYNAFTLRLILDYWNDGELKSIKDIPASKRWKDQRWQVGGQVWSLNQIEHEQIRPKFKEPRIHFALVCAAYSCPKLLNQAYQADRLEAQLADQTRYTHQGDRWLSFDSPNNVVGLTKLYDWYGGDFRQVSGSVLNYVAQHSKPVKQAIDVGRPPRIKWLDYSWQLNSQTNTP